MSADTVTWAVALLQIAGAVGIIIFWAGFFRDKPHDEWLPPGFLEHESAFVYADSTIALLLVVSALLALFEHAAAAPVALVAAGMLLFLGIIDAAYMAQNGLFARERNGAVHFSIVASVLSMSAMLVLRYA